MSRLIQHSAQAFGLVCVAMLSTSTGAEGIAPPTSRIDLPVVATTERYPPYKDFCKRQPTACELAGPPVVRHSPKLMNDLQTVTRLINRTVQFALDAELYSVEDYWTLPESGYGDCEDMALAKRAHLVGLGYPSAALRLAFVFDRQELSAHCILTVETTGGTFLLDSYSDDVMHWAGSPYNFEARERPDGRWDRFDQSLWRYVGSEPRTP